MSASQRPTGGDKAMATKKQYFRRKKVCRFCVEKIDDINYKDVRMLMSFISERGKISAAPDFGRVRAAPAPFGGGDQAGAQHRADSVRRVDLVTRAKRSAARSFGSLWRCAPHPLR